MNPPSMSRRKAMAELCLRDVLYLTEKPKKPGKRAHASPRRKRHSHYQQCTESMLAFRLDMSDACTLLSENFRRICAQSVTHCPKSGRTLGGDD